MRTGLLISFEGIDGCGKSTQLARLVERLRAVDVEPLLVREPGGTGLGERVRDADATRADAPTLRAFLQGPALKPARLVSVGALLMAAAPQDAARGLRAIGRLRHVADVLPIILIIHRIE